MIIPVVLWASFGNLYCNIYVLVFGSLGLVVDPLFAIPSLARVAVSLFVSCLNLPIGSYVVTVFVLVT